jgi:hypothetical protein
MAEGTSSSEPEKGPFKITRLLLPAGHIEGGRAPVGPLLVEMIEKSRRALELELGKRVR